MVLQRVYASLICLISLVVFIYLIRFVTHLRSPLQDVPGPTLAIFSRLWYASELHGGRHQHTLLDLHRKHGAVVRYAPNCYSLAPSNVETVRQLYGAGTKFVKTSWYSTWQLPGAPNYFSVQDNEQHAQMRKKATILFSMSSMITYQAFVDDCVEEFCHRMREISVQPEPVMDMGYWYRCFAADAIGKVSWGERLGFLDQGEDIDGLLQNMEEGLLYSCIIGIWSWLHQPLVALSSFLARHRLAKPRGTDAVSFWINGAIRREQRLDQARGKGTMGNAAQAPKHFLKKLFDSPDNFNYNETFMVLSVNIMAGADTTGGTLSNILYLLMRNPGVFTKLRREIDDAWVAGNLSSPITFQQAQSLSYLQAVIQEAFRLEPVIGLVLPRIVPAGGAVIGGRFFPSGSTVGICPSVVHRNKEIFGENADEFYPERWLETDVETLKTMHRALLHFGIGSRTCMGKNVVSTASSSLMRNNRTLMCPRACLKSTRCCQSKFANLTTSSLPSLKARNGRRPTTSSISHKIST